MCIDDFVGGNDSTGMTAELTDVEILAEVTTEPQTKTLPRLYPQALIVPRSRLRPRLQRFWPYRTATAAL
ncbi:hypothetical protein HPB48_025970 [Haemaphysalis longicornis]|uniref:Uncharacterized protein n=1 Tax=Haemaphysalis longicornis TaxID=44386 RepID=A0A9J6HAH3_HAELO|nr:hypothetical protein HPB48_025970 [Haemaphysalis longicornis]